MAICSTCGAQIPDSHKGPCPKCGSLRIQAFETINVTDTESAALWQTYSFAPEWFRDVLRESHTQRDPHSRRRQILFAVCFAESYLFEWVRDDVLKGNFKELAKYFPYNDRRGIRHRWKEVLKDLHRDGLTKGVPDFGDSHWEKFQTLVDYRDGLVHAKASRPERVPPSGDKPVPSKVDLDQLHAHWAAEVVVELAERLHAATLTSRPAWLTGP